MTSPQIQARQPMSERIRNGVSCVFALWTLCCYFSVWVGGSLQSLIALFAVVLGIATWLLTRFYRGEQVAYEAETSLWFGADAEKWKTTRYVDLAVQAADNPGAALMRDDGLHGITGITASLPVHRFHTYEFLNGALSYLTGSPRDVLLSLDLRGRRRGPHLSQDPRPGTPRSLPDGRPGRRSRSLARRRGLFSPRS